MAINSQPSTINRLPGLPPAQTRANTILAAQDRSLIRRKWKSVLLNPKAHARARKRAIIAFARQLLIDLWRWQTGRRTPEQLGWVMTQG